jgi:ligand-binding SRPBCC domain-containing protein
MTTQTASPPTGDRSARVLEERTFLPVSPEEVFSFFSDAENLERITPPFLQFSITTPRPIEMREGTTIDYRLKLFGLPMAWRSVITRWDPPRGFIDSQVKGPYRQWIHEHLLEPVEGGTLMTDRVSYRVPGGPLEPLIHAMFIRPSLGRIFGYRKQVVRDLFAATDVPA